MSYGIVFRADMFSWASVLMFGLFMLSVFGVFPAYINYLFYVGYSAIIILMLYYFFRERKMNIGEVEGINYVERKKITLSRKNSFGVFCVPKIARQFFRISSVVNYIICKPSKKTARGLLNVFSSRNFIILTLALLGSCSLFLAFQGLLFSMFGIDSKKIAEKLAEYAYYALIIGVIGIFISSLRQKADDKDSG